MAGPNPFLVTPGHLLNEAVKQRPAAIPPPHAIVLNDWDLLGLRKHPELIRATIREVESHGLGSSSARKDLLRPQPYIALEELVARKMHCEDAVLFSSRTQAVFSLFSFLLINTDRVLAFSHQTSSVFDCATMVGADYRFLEEFSHDSQPSCYVFLELAHPHTGMTISPALPVFQQLPSPTFVLDESFSFAHMGVLGGGLGATIALPFCAKILDLSLLCAGNVCAVAGSSELCAVIRQKSKIFQSEICPSVAGCVSARRALLLIEEMNAERLKITELTESLVKVLRRLGVNSNRSGGIVCIETSAANSVFHAQRALYAHGLLVDAFVSGHRSSPKGFIRLLINASLDAPAMIRIFEAIENVAARHKKESGKPLFTQVKAAEIGHRTT